MIPACVPGVLRRLHILSLEVQRMPKQYGQEFALPADYPYESVSTIGTHDMGTLRQWWAEDEARAARFYRDVLHGTGQPPGDASPDLCRQVVQQHLDGTSMLCILSLQDWLSMDGDLRNPRADEEQINVPADPHHHWQYRMHLNIEQLQRARQFNDRLRDMLRRSDRMPEL